MEIKQTSQNNTGSIKIPRINWVSAGAILGLILIALFIISFALGRYPVSPLDVIKVLVSHVLPIDHTWRNTVETVVMQIRLPRILAAMLVGASLALAGASFQGLFRNPLVSPDILGVSSGAGFGAALAILLKANIGEPYNCPLSVSLYWQLAFRYFVSAGWSKAILLSV